MLKKYFKRNKKEVFKNEANKEVKLTRIFANNKFILILGIIILILVTIGINLFISFILYTLDSIKGEIAQIKIMDILIPSKEFILVYVVAYIFLLLGYIKFIFKVKASFRDIKDGQKGTARFTTEKEIEEQYKKIHCSTGEIQGYGGVPVYRKNDYLYIDDDNVNTSGVGISRSGKTQIFVLPTIENLSRAKEKASMIITDMKGELTKYTKFSLEERGYDIKVVNLMDLYNTICFNPLSLIIEAYKNGELGEAQLLAKSLTYTLYYNPNSKEPMWQNSAMSLVSALIMALCDKCLTLNKDLVGKSDEELQKIKESEKKVTLYTVSILLSDLGARNTPAGNALDLYFDSLPKNSPAKLLYATSKFSEGKARSSIFTVAMDKLQIFTYEKVAKFTSKNDLNIKDLGFGEKPIALFFVIPEFDKSLYELVSIMCNQIYYVLAKEASLSVDDKCKRKVKYILDEFGNLPAFDNLEGAFTMGLGKNIEYFIFFQSFKQIKAKYGEEKAEIIIGGCGNKILIATGEKDTSEEFSELLGDMTITQHSRSGGLFSINKQQTESVDSRKLKKADELRKLKLGEFILVRSMKRLDLNGNKIEPTPIFTGGKNALEFAYKYLGNFLNKGLTLSELKLGDYHKDIDLSTLVINLDDEIEDLMLKRYEKIIEENNKYQELNERIQEKLNKKEERKINKSLNNLFNQIVSNDKNEDSEKNKNNMKDEEEVKISFKEREKIKSNKNIKKLLTKEQMDNLMTYDTYESMVNFVNSVMKNIDVKNQVIKEIEKIANNI